MKADIELHKRRLGSGGALPTTSDTVHGLIVIFTGRGKGKSSAAFTMAQRAILQQIKVGVVQFFGGAVHSAEYRSLASNPLCDFQICCNQCSWHMKDHHHDRANVNHAWEQAMRMMDDPAYGMVIFDDIMLMIRNHYLDLSELMAALRRRRPDVHIVMTGRYAPIELTDFADLVTEMRDVKHPYSKLALPPQAGIEF